MFIKNKYKKLYFKLIKCIKQRNSNYVNFEVHHIIPRSLTGSDYKKNLIKVTPREHFILHKLLTKFTRGIYLQKMKAALFIMTIHNKQQKSRFMKRMF